MGDAADDVYWSASYDDDACDHDDAELDILTGCLECSCGHRRYLTAEECDRYIRMMHQAEEAFAAETADALPSKREAR